MERKMGSNFVGREFWYPLDNAAKIYPAITTDEISSVFRLTVNLKQKINIRFLFKAVKVLEPRFPYFFVHLKRGFFWYYLESTTEPTLVEVDTGILCKKFDLDGNLFRVLVKDRTLSVEFSHMLTDGTGGFEYLTTLLVEYFKLTGLEPTDEFSYLKVDQEPHPEEFEDAFNRYFQEDIPASKARPKAFHLPFALRSKPRFDVLYAILPADQIKERAKAREVTVTEYLLAIYFSVLQDIWESLPARNKHKRQRKLALEVPINIRKLYPSKTMRNFTLFVMPEIDLSLGHYSFDEILKSVFHQMRMQTDIKLINKILALNVGGERNLLIRGIPLFLKTFFMRRLYWALGSVQYSGVLTNMGVKQLPPSMAEQIDALFFTPPPANTILKAGCGVVSMNDKLVISFCNIAKSKEFERRFVEFLVKEGIQIKLTTNQ